MWKNGGKKGRSQFFWGHVVWVHGICPVVKQGAKAIRLFPSQSYQQKPLGARGIVPHFALSAGFCYGNPNDRAFSAALAGAGKASFVF
jgi:hypothetical protein